MKVSKNCMVFLVTSTKIKKQNTIWQDIEKILQQISPLKIHDDYTSLTNELEKLSTSFDWWKNERNLEVHLDPDKLVESRMIELNESKYMIESYEFVKLLEKVKKLLFNIHAVYFYYAVSHYRHVKS